MLVEMILVSYLTMSPRIWFIECIIQVLFLDIDDSHSASQVPQCKWEIETNQINTCILTNLKFIYTSSKYKSYIASIATAYYRKNTLSKQSFALVDLNVFILELSILLLYK